MLNDACRALKDVEKCYLNDNLCVNKQRVQSISEVAAWKLPW